MSKRSRSVEIPPWEDSDDHEGFTRQPLNLKEQQRRDAKNERRRRAFAAYIQASAFLGSRGCKTSLITGKRQLNKLLSICYGVQINKQANTTKELIRATDTVQAMGRKERRRRMNRALNVGHPLLRRLWNESKRQ
jgi:hypothetical protein